MALTPAERQRRRRERLKKEGTSRRDWILEPDELRMLGEICVLRRPGRVPYSENEVIGLLIRKTIRSCRSSYLLLARDVVKKCLFQNAFLMAKGHATLQPRG